MDERRRGMVGPLAPFWLGFRVELTRLGFASWSTDTQLSLMADLSRWLDRQQLGPADLSVAVVDRFLDVRRTTHVSLVSGRALVPLLGYLRGLGVAPQPVVAVPSGPVDVLLARYAGQLRHQRGLSESTIGYYLDLVRPLLCVEIVCDETDLAKLDASTLIGFVTQYSAAGVGTPRRLTTALRSLLRFLRQEGLLSSALDDAVPTVADRPSGVRDRSLTPADLTALVAACDRAGSVGLRDSAILAVLVRLGLRAGEVASLSLEDLDWRRGTVQIRGKSGPAVLPLPADVGKVVARYLVHGRPSTALDRSVFLRCKAPHRGIGRAAVSAVVARASRRAGLPELVHAHRLRHTAAAAVVRAGGGMAEAGQLLGHARPVTTAVYATAGVEAMTVLTRPWPGTDGPR